MACLEYLQRRGQDKIRVKKRKERAKRGLSGSAGRPPRPEGERLGAAQNRQLPIRPALKTYATQTGGLSNDTGLVDTQAIPFIPHVKMIHSDPISESVYNQQEIQVGLVHQIPNFVSIGSQSTNPYVEVTGSADFN